MEVRILAFFAGVCLLHAQPVLPSAWLASVILLIGALALVRRSSWWLAACLSGVLWAWWHAAGALQQKLPTALDGAVVTVYGTVAGLPEVRQDRLRFRFRISHSVEYPRLSGTAWLSWYDTDTAVRPGEYWRIRVRLRRPRGFANPGGFDYAGWLFRQRLDATGYVRRGSAQRLRASGWRQPLARLRLNLASRIAAALGDSAMLPVVLALTVGDRSQMTARHWQALSATGTGHLMAISGLHIGLVAGSVFMAVRRLWGMLPVLAGRLSATDAAAALALAAAVSYAALAGFSLPTRRALVMLALGLFALVRRRRTDVLRGLCSALALVLLVDPLAPLSPGFWLSFGAVAAIAWSMQGYFPTYRHVAAWLRVQLAVFAGLVPATLWQFGQVSMLSPVLNLLLVPLFGVAVMPLVLIGVVLLPVLPEPAAWLLRAGAAILAAVWPLIDWVAQADAALWRPAPRPAWTLVAALAAAVLVLSPLGWRLAPLCVMLALPLATWRPPMLAAGAFSVHMLDVGQGLAAVVTTRHHRMVFDTGGQFRSGTRLADLVLLPFLRGGLPPTMLIVSHADLDHRGGVAPLLDAYPNLVVYSGEALTEGRHTPCAAGQAWRWDAVQFDVLHPDESRGWSGNNASCVLRISGAGGAVLLTGDIEAAAEAHMAAAGRTLAADVVLGPHHGSGTSSTQDFIAATGARHVVFAAGHGNRWNFPRPAVARRWQSAGARVWITGRDGAVTIQAEPGLPLPRVSAWRHVRGHYWQR